MQQHGHIVLPDKGLPLIGHAYRKEVSDYLSRSQLSVHLIGEYYGTVPEGERRSVIELQNDLAAIEGSRLQRIIWMPVGLQPKEESQQEFVSQLRRGLSSQQGTDLLETKLEDLKTVIQEKLAQKDKKDKKEAASATPGNGVAATVYLIYDNQDADSAMPIVDYLLDNGLYVISPATEGNEKAIIDDHIQNLKMCDAVMIYYGRAGEIWLRAKQRELMKIAGYGRTAPLAAKAIYISGPPTSPKERIRDLDALIIRNYEAFSPEPLQPFLERVQRAKGI